MTSEFAETYALTILSWLVGNEDLLPIFLGATGASGDDLRENANSPEFLGAVLDFVLMDDQWVISATDATGLNPELMSRARQMLPGGEQVNWT